MEKRIIIIDDDKDILEALKELLEIEGYVVKINPNGDNVLALIEQFKPNTLLLDFLLSGKDGASICKAIRQCENTKFLPIIMMSAHPYAQKAIADCGANEFIRKPFDVEYLLRILTAYSK